MKNIDISPFIKAFECFFTSASFDTYKYMNIIFDLPDSPYSYDFIDPVLNYPTLRINI